MWVWGNKLDEFVFYYNQWSTDYRFLYMEVWFLGPESGQAGMILISLLWFLRPQRNMEQSEKSL